MGSGGAAPRNVDPRLLPGEQPARVWYCYSLLLVLEPVHLVHERAVAESTVDEDARLGIAIGSGAQAGARHRQSKSPHGVPSGDHATEFTALPCPSSGPPSAGSPVAASHTRTVLCNSLFFDL